MLCSLAHTGHGASCWIASPRARIAGKGDLENGWKRSSCERMGVFFSAPFEGELNDESLGLLLNQLRNVRVLVYEAPDSEGESEGESKGEG